MSESTDGTALPTAASIEDANSATWTLRWIDRAVLKNGASSGIVNVMEVWYLNHVVWAFKGTHWRYYDNGLSRWRAGTITSSDMPDALSERGGLRAPVGPQVLASYPGVQCSPGNDLNQISFDNPPGTTFVLAIGTYNQQVITPKPGQRFIGLHNGTNGAVLDGQSVSGHAFGGYTGYVVVHNLIVKNYTDGFQTGSVHMGNPYNQISNCEIFNSGGAGVFCFDYLLVLSNKIHDNTYEGYNCSSNIGVLFDNNEIYDNNPSESGGDRGGGKSSDTQHLSYWYNHVHDNWGSGLWTDYDNINFDVWRNELGPGNYNGFEHEIGYNARMMHNYIHDTGLGEDFAFFASSGIAIENSGGSSGGGRAGDEPGIIEIAYNKMVLGDWMRAITGRQQDRGKGSQYSTGERRNIRNVYIHHNDIDWSAVTSDSFTDGLMGFSAIPDDSKIWEAANIVIDNNTYTVGDRPFEFSWDNLSRLNFQVWQSYGHDLNGSVVGQTFSSAKWSTSPTDHTDPLFPLLEYIRISDNDLIATHIQGTAHVQGKATVSIASGQKRYWELVVLEHLSGFNSVGVGVTDASVDMINGQYIGLTTHGIAYYPDGGVLKGSTVATLAAFGRGAIIGVACHGGNKIWFRLGTGGWNNDVIGNQNPATGTGGIDISGMGTVKPAYDLFGGKVFGNFGNTFLGTLPSGFTAFT